MGTILDRAVVLVADCNSDSRRLMRRMLRGEGVGTVMEASDGAEALRQFKINLPDVLVTEMAMTPIDGLELTRFVRKSKQSPNPYMGIIGVCGQADVRMVLRARDEGVSEFLIKPFSVNGLMRHVTKLLDRPRPFVRSDTYFGPDRRRKTLDWKGNERRKKEALAAAPLGGGRRPA